MKRKRKEQRGKKSELETGKQWSWLEQTGRKRARVSKTVTEG